MESTSSAKGGSQPKADQPLAGATNFGGKKQQMVGIVVSDKMQKTVVVKVDMKKRHPKYKKAYTVSKKFKAHDENNEYHIGDRVVMESVRPKSREKRFKVIKKV